MRSAYSRSDAVSFVSAHSLVRKLFGRVEIARSRNIEGKQWPGIDSSYLLELYSDLFFSTAQLRAFASWRTRVFSGAEVRIYSQM